MSNYLKCVSVDFTGSSADDTQKHNESEAYTSAT